MKNNFFYKLLITVAMSLLLIVITACADPEPNSDSDTQTKSDSSEDNSVTISVISRWAQTNDLLEDQLVPEFEEENPDIKVNLITTPGEDYPKALQASIQSEDLPDIIASHPSMPVYKLKELDLLRDLDDLIGDRKNDYEEGMWTEGGAMVDGKIYALPLYTNTSDSVMMYYNKALLEEAGLTEEDLPKTWDELISVSEIIMDKTDAHGTYLELNNWAMDLFIKQMASAITPEVSGEQNYHTGSYDYNTEGNIESIKFIEELIDKGIDHPSDIAGGAGEGALLFAANKVAFYFNGSWSASMLAEEGFDIDDYGVTTVPTKNGEKPYIGYSGADLGGGFLVSKDTEHYDEVKKFLKFIMDEGYTAIVESEAAYPPTPEIIENADEPDTARWQALKQNQENSIITPDPIMKNEHATKVKEKMSGKGADEDLGDVVNGYVSGQIEDLEEILQKMTDAENQAFEKALKDVQDAGNDIDESAWVFPDWVPGEPYVEN